MAENSGNVAVLPPPDGYIVDFLNPQRRAIPHAYWIAGFGTFLSLLFMAQRLYTKVVCKAGFQIEDVFLLVSWLLCITVIALSVRAFAVGAAGVHAWEISIDKFNVFLQGVYIAPPIYNVGGSFAKISLLLFYLRISPQKWFRVAIWATLAAMSVYTTAIFFALIFSCRPMSMSWDVRAKGGVCINRPALYIAMAALNIISDVVLLGLPLPVVLRVQMPRRQKFGLLLIFLLCSITIVTSIIRVILLPQMLTSVDQTWVISWNSVWVIVEANLFIICASLPTMRKFLNHVAPKLLGGSSPQPDTPIIGMNGRTLRTIGMVSTSGAAMRRRDYTQFDPEEDATQGKKGQSFPMSEFSTAATTDEGSETRKLCCSDKHRKEAKEGM